MRFISKKLWFFVPVVAAVGVFILISTLKSRPEEDGGEEQATYVRTCKVQELAVVPRVTGYGTVMPVKIWKAVPEVSGKIVWMSPKLNEGEFFRKGNPLLRIDDSSYKLKVTEYTAEVKKTEANLLELAARKKDYETSLALLKKSLEFNLKELERQRRLAEHKAVSVSALEQEEIAVLAEKNNVQNMQTTLNLLPSQIKYQQAQLESARAKLEQAKLDLKHTEIKAPFNCRIAKVDVEISQYVQPGSSIIEADSIDASEVVAQIDTGKMSHMMMLIRRKKMPENLLIYDKAIPERLGLKAVISFTPDGRTFSWNARCERIESIDMNTRTVGIAAVVDDPYRGKGGPPLVKGMYCEVTVSGPPQPGCLVIPRSALHGDSVYLVTADNRLKIKKVEVLFSMSDFSIIQSGLKKGDRIVTSDIIPAINGMKLEAVPDKELTARIIASATGGGLRND